MRPGWRSVGVVAMVAGPAAIGVLLGYFGTLEGKCRRGDGIACGVLADGVRQAAKGDEDLARACDLYRRACAGGNDVGCSNLGALLARGKCTGGPGEALDVLQRACDHGDLGGCNNLGMVLRDGVGVPADRARAAALFERACERVAIACHNLGALLQDIHPSGAAAAFQAGCEMHEEGEAPASCCYELGLVELHAADPNAKERAAAHFRRACDGGPPGACNNLGLMYANGIGVPRDDALAAALLQKACDGNELRACANLGSRYVSGLGVAMDPARGKALIERACKGGVSEACVPPRGPD